MFGLVKFAYANSVVFRKTMIGVNKTGDWNYLRHVELIEHFKNVNVVNFILRKIVGHNL